MDLQVILALITAVTCIEFVDAADASAGKIVCSLPTAKQGENATLTCIFKNIPKLNSEMTVNARGVKFADSKTVSVLALEFLNTPDRLNKVVDKHFEFGNVLSSDDDNWNVSVIFPRSNQDYQGNYDCQLVGPNNPSPATCPFTLDTLAEQGLNSTSVSPPVEQQNVSDGGGPLIDSKSQGSENNTTVTELTREAVKTGGLQGGVIAGITVSVLVVVIVGAAVIIYCCLKRRKKKARPRQRRTSQQDIEKGEPMNRTAERELLEMNSKMEVKDKLITSLEEEKQKILEERQKLQGEYELLAKEIEKRNAAINRLTAEIQGLETKLQNVQGQHDELGNPLQKEKGTISELKEKLQNKKNKIQMLQRNKQEKEQQLQKKERKIADLEKREAVLKERNDNLSHEKEQLLKDKADLQISEAVLKDRNERLSREKEQLLKDKAELQISEAVLKERNEHLSRKEMSDLKEQVRELQGRFKEDDADEEQDISLLVQNRPAETPDGGAGVMEDYCQ